MAFISCDMRYGRTDEQKRKLASGLLGVLSAATGEPADNIFFEQRTGTSPSKRRWSEAAPTRAGGDRLIAGGHRTQRSE